MLKHFTRLKSLSYNDVEKYVENVEKHEFSTNCWKSELKAARQSAGKPRHALHTAHRAYRMTSNKKFQKKLLTNPKSVV